MEATAPGWRLGRRPVLDGVRGIAILLVVLYHSDVPGVGAAGTVGVTVFFTLSGFLITALLLEEHERAGRIDLRAFYLRRARRLLPALVVFVAVLVLAGLVVGRWLADVRDVPWVAFYASNWVRVPGGDIGALNHTWSLAIEEQFYLVWPLVLMFVLPRHGARAVVRVALAGAAASLLVRFLVWDGGDGAAHVYFGSDSRADGLLVGCALAGVLHRGAAPWPGRSTAYAGLALVVLVSFSPGTPALLLAPSVAAWATAAVILAVVQRDEAGWLGAAPVRWLGRRSYAVYLWHAAFGVCWERWTDTGWELQLLVVGTLSLVVAELSWRCVEERWLAPRAREPSPFVAGI